MLFPNLRRALASFLLVATSVAAQKSTLKQLTASIGSNPTNYFGETKYAGLADTHGFVVLFPSAPGPGTTCWDVHSTGTLTHNSGGDSLGLANFVRYALSTYGGDAGKVFVTGTSSGAMMTNVLVGAYPDLFVSGAAFSGVPYGCFAGSSNWNSQCADGKLIKTAAAWGDEARAGYPGYNGTRPRLQLWHGTADTTLYYQNFVEANKQWPNVLGISFTKNNTNTPQSGYTQMVFGDGTQYVGYSAQGVGHTVPVHESAVLDWFGITGNT
ncbi:carbohydrate esterase family 1 protein [Hyaloscypha variabilis F]|uniref:Carbohydrate esterase family 1 protein n=1 Tax=Hyaloscypha variabilis (strain UAMH 11265 / GT02V1 / F) TaxID=1149755 RepID=A0A2J6RJC4_HYAVF|nr:carbohydrate esterase family 1 protein [Hyaloscypha variabilis F]